MKRLLLIGLLIFGVGQTSSLAQNDDIYFNSSDIEKQKKEDRKRAEEEARRVPEQDEDAYDTRSREDSREEGYGRSYESDGYVDYENDYSYATQIRRFNYPFYNMGYYSAFYNPYWYDPYWADPYWGWSPWSRPGFSISFGYGPYWNSYWGWHTWYGYPAYYSYWNAPFYGGYGGYYSGFWNGYYAGLYNSYNPGRTINYGPRNATNSSYNVGIRRASAASGQVQQPGTPGGRPGMRVTNPSQSAGATDRNVPGRVNRPVLGERVGEIRNVPAERNGTISNPQPAAERPARREFSREEEGIRFENRQPRQVAEPGRNEIRRERMEEQPRYQQPRQQPVRQQPATEQRQQRYEQPRYERQSQPSYQSPRMSSPRPSSPATSPSPRSSGGRR